VLSFAREVAGSKPATPLADQTAGCSRALIRRYTPPALSSGAGGRRGAAPLPVRGAPSQGRYSTTMYEIGFLRFRRSILVAIAA
jgi:hypothetical protein